ncbi:hypothetical protein LA303_08900 [Candidatus Sulfidibacterium hydrothermale]|uniref:hypothetical protein n=1 Tax=Candidatus Sulfidibacterium hydrothermale TaxID=2875962 RepID=UPI001F0A7056|nr:hypothetical protein [Candidatus Sulfidibacterium hydrothermale]UBM61533.1 hypothetical protein LA303_08900 [Candidatus Sulfidibacterium hydrothermale]
MAYGSSQIVYGVAQIMNEATGKKKDLSKGPISLTGAGIDKAAKTDGTFEKIGEVIENVINLKTILSPSSTKVEQTVNDVSTILNITNETLSEDKKKKQKEKIDN